MPITATTPLNIPATPIRTFAHWWMRNLTIVAHPPGEIYANAEMLPYDAGAQETLDQPQGVTINVGELLAQEAGTGPVTTAMGTLLAVIAQIGKAQGKL